MTKIKELEKDIEILNQMKNDYIHKNDAVFKYCIDNINKKRREINEKCVHFKNNRCRNAAGCGYSPVPGHCKIAGDLSQVPYKYKEYGVKRENNFTLQRMDK